MRPTASRIAIQLSPRAGLDRIDGVVDGASKARVAAAPVDGAANAARVRLIAQSLGVPRIEIEGIAPAELRSRWPGLTV